MVPPQVGQDLLGTAGGTCWWFSSAEEPPRLWSPKPSQQPCIAMLEIPAADKLGGNTLRRCTGLNTLPAPQAGPWLREKADLGRKVARTLCVLSRTRCMVGLEPVAPMQRGMDVGAFCSEKLIQFL